MLIYQYNVSSHLLSCGLQLFSELKIAPGTFSVQPTKSEQKEWKVRATALQSPQVKRLCRNLQKRKKLLRNFSQNAGYSAIFKVYLIAIAFPPFCMSTAIPEYNKHIWHLWEDGIDPGYCYSYIVDDNMTHVTFTDCKSALGIVRKFVIILT